MEVDYDLLWARADIKPLRKPRLGGYEVFMRKLEHIVYVLCFCANDLESSMHNFPVAMLWLMWLVIITLVTQKAKRDNEK